VGINHVLRSNWTAERSSLSPERPLSIRFLGACRDAGQLFAYNS
jgi:hypothetical protein